MAQATYAIGNFTGGEISQFAQGRFDKPDYRISLKACLNSFPVEIGPWTRRPGTMFAGTTLNGAPGRVIEFAIEQQAAITLEFTDGNLRFRMGPTLVAGTLATPYTGGSWASLRAVQAETTDILLAPLVAPQALTVTTLPSTGVDPVFALAPAIFNDGPYLDPFINGVEVTPNATTGIISLTLNFDNYSATKAYSAKSFVTSSGVNYISLVDQNVNNTPASSPAFWTPTSAAAAINDGRGFLGSDIGRLVRLLSEPAGWLSGSTYSIGAIVSYNPSGQTGASTYWQSLVNTNTGNAPGADLTHWELLTTAAIWTWGKITSLSTIIDRSLSGSIAFGNMSTPSACFDGVFSKSSGPGISAFGVSSTASGGDVITVRAYVGKNYSGASAQKIQEATVYPSNNLGLANGTTSAGAVLSPAMQVNLYGKSTAPGASNDGTLLGTSGIISNTVSAVTILSSDQVTTWNYVWIEIVGVFTIPGISHSLSYNLAEFIGQISFFNPAGTGVNTGANVEILGPPLLYTNPILNWRLGVYSDTTGWPTCGVYNDGRLYLGGAVANRFDACFANGIVGSTINFAPTDQFGAVTPAHAISYTFNSNGVNPILWMVPDLQGVIMGTQAGEWLIQAPTAGPIAPTNITARNVTSHGSANIQPVRTEHTTIFIQRHALKLLEYFPDVFSGKFSAPNLADKAQHLTRAGVSELAYTSATTPIIWGRCTDGSWFGITYKRDSLASSQPPTFYGWHRHLLGSGRVVESICAGPSVGGDLDALTMVTNDPATGIRHVEILTNEQDELTPLTSSWFLDDAVTPTVTIGVNSAVLSGLSHLEGKTVQVFAGGLDCGDPGEGKAFADFVVSGGQVTIPYGDSISSGAGRGLFTQAFAQTNPAIVVGFTYNSDGHLARPITPADSGARNGPAFAKLSRGHRYGMMLVNTLGLSVGGDLTGKMYPALFKTPGNKDIPALTTFSGIHQDSLRDDYGYDGGTPAWRVSRPFPATIVIIATNLATQDQ